MNIGGLQIGFGTEIKDSISLNIYLSGCKNNKKCNMQECHNQALRDFDYGKPVEKFYDKIQDLLITNNIFIDTICIMGGEPLDQCKEDLLRLILFLKQNSKIPVYVYTGYDEIDFVDSYKRLLEVDGIYYGSYIGSESTKKFI
jgi:organic radical activating enzyme